MCVIVNGGSRMSLRVYQQNLINNKYGSFAHNMSLILCVETLIFK